MKEKKNLTNDTPPVRNSTSKKGCVGSSVNRKKIGVIVNETNLKASGNVTLEQVRDLFKRENLTAEIKTARARRLAEVARGFVSSGMDCIVAAGGDGTMSSIAAVLAGTRIPMGVLPIGTLNHFARDLGILFDVEQAVRIITKGEPQGVDVGEVNGRIFINNSSIGLYPAAVRLREKYLDRLGGNKWIAMALALLTVFRRFPLFTVKLEAKGAGRSASSMNAASNSCLRDICIMVIPGMSGRTTREPAGPSLWPRRGRPYPGGFGSTQMPIT
jgi:diacylglycerol kinase family enzyme